jgi:hypothetical protein
MTTRRAECSCGQLSVTCVGEPFRVGVCHCFGCKQKTGSALGSAPGFESAARAPALVFSNRTQLHKLKSTIAIRCQLRKFCAYVWPV